MLSAKCMLQFAGNDSSNTLLACSGNFSLTESGSEKGITNIRFDHLKSMCFFSQKL